MKIEKLSSIAAFSPKVPHKQFSEKWHDDSGKNPDYFVFISHYLDVGMVCLRKRLGWWLVLLPHTHAECGREIRRIAGAWSGFELSVRGAAGSLPDAQSKHRFLPDDYNFTLTSQMPNKIATCYDKKVRFHPLSIWLSVIKNMENYSPVIEKLPDMHI